MRQNPTSFFHQYAHDFDAVYDGDTSPWRKTINRRLRRSMFLRYNRSLAACEPVAGKRILDVGCGPGHYAVALAAMGASVVGVDSADAMIDLATERAMRAGVASQCRFVCQPLEAFSPEHTFNHAVCMGFLEYLPQPGEAIDRIMNLVTESALFSLPDRRGFLAFQRRIRYRWKTPLFMYSKTEAQKLFGRSSAVAECTLEQLHRDVFVVALPQVAEPGAQTDNGH